MLSKTRNTTVKKKPPIRAGGTRAGLASKAGAAQYHDGAETVRAVQAWADASPAVAQLRQWRALADAQDEPTPASTENDVVQRAPKIGFELEDGDWRTWKKVAKTSLFSSRRYVDAAHANGIRPAVRKEVLHHGTGFDVEADGLTEGGEKLADMEFVTRPFPLDDGGHRALETALAEISSIYRRLGPLSGRDHRQGQFVERGRHRFSEADVALSMGAERAKLNLQATSGLALGDIPKVFSAMTTNTETVETHNPDAYIAIQYGNTRDQPSDTNVTLRPLAEAPERAFFLCLDYLYSRLPADEADTINGAERSVFGFLTALVAFLRAMKTVSVQGGAKTYAPMMHRNDFATMFKMIPEAARDVLQRHQQTFIDAVIYGVVKEIGADPEGHAPQRHRTAQVVDKFFLDSAFRNKFFGNEELPTSKATDRGVKSISYSVIPDFTIQRWINGWIAGGAPVDMMTEAEFSQAATRDVDEDADLGDDLEALKTSMSPQIAAIIDWEGSYMENPHMARLKFDYSKLSPEQKRLLDFHLRGLGSEGDRLDTEGEEDLALFENRAMAPVDADLHNLPTEVPMKVAEESLLSYFVGMMRLLNPDQER